jgi:hypothetical protein
MDRKLSDEQLDRIAKNLLKDFTLDEETLGEIAGSPRLWWNVRRRIETEKARREQSWLAVFRPSIFAFGALAIVVCFGFAVWFSNSAGNSNYAAGQPDPVQPRIEEIAGTPAAASPLVSPETDLKNPEISKNPAPENAPVKISEPKTKFVARHQVRENPAKRTGQAPGKKIPAQIAVEETKTDFIALSYAADTGRGQIVRVKVPSSMMVSLGVAANVEKDSALVNAEVVIGDDGLARAIRFIR